jgi:penicillin amidase
VGTLRAEEKTNMMRWFKRGLWLLGLLALAVALAVWLYAQRSLPQMQGEVQLPGLRAGTEVLRDAHGIPTIRAQNLHDAAFAMGVVHVQDRLWQMETHRRIGSGRLAEAFGEGALDNDKFLRALGVRRAAQAQWAYVQAQVPETRDVLLAYTAGVNAAMKQMVRARPPEFLILGLPLEEWTPADSIAWTIMMAWDLGGNWERELHRLRLALNLPMARLHELMPPYPGDMPLATRDLPALYRGLGLSQAAAKASLDEGLQRLATAAPESGVEGVGSNNWVLSGSHTTTGTPLLANDPHLKLSAPALWYFARIELPGMKVAGATLPGLPTIVLGQNEHIAWGFTNTGPDVQDLYLERVLPGSPERVQTPTGDEPLQAVTETIHVKGKPDVQLRVRIGRHGPFISDAGTARELLKLPDGSSLSLAMRWTALDADADPVGVGLSFMRARSVGEFVQATRTWVAPMQNMVVADKAGRIAVVSPGRLPLRKPENDLRGLAPAPGWEAKYDWAGWVPADQTPREADPPRGWIATANQRIHGSDYPHFVTSEWALPYRQQRIEQLLSAKPKHSLDDLAAIQADVKSLAAPKLLPTLKAVRSMHPLAAAAQSQLQGFDGEMRADSAAPLIYWVWVRQFTERVVADKLPAGMFERLLRDLSFRDAIEAAVARNDVFWCDVAATPAAESCAQQADAAFSAAMDELSARLGSDLAKWRWAEVHQARSEHRPFSRVKALAPLFELRVPTGGDTYTVNVSRVGLRADATTGERYLNEHAASLRALYDVANPANSRVMHSTGQSGHPLSGRYRSFVQPWAAVQYVPLWPAEGAPVDKLKLLPAAP